MKSKINALICTLLLSSTVVGCTSVPAAKTTPTPSVAATAPPVNATADLPVAVARITKKAYDNKTFSQELQADPKAVLTDEGIKVATHEKVRVVNILNEEGKVYMILDDRNLEHFYSEQIKNAPSDAEANETLKTYRAIRAKAQTDATFKAKLLADPATVLTTEGINAEAAKNFEILDYEPDTHYFMLLPPDQQVTRSSEICDLTSPFQNPFCPVPLPWIIMMNLAAKTIVPGSVSSIETAAQGVFHTIEAGCFFPRLFGASCGVPLEDIKQGLRNATSVKTNFGQN